MFTAMTDVTFNLGEKIKRLRTERNLALKDVAESTGFSKALISRIEHNLVSPPIGTLYRISQALNVKMRDFFEEAPVPDDLWLVRASERSRAFRDGSRYGYHYESLAADPSLPGFEPLLVTLQPELRERVHFFTHQGWEFIHIIGGRMSFHYGKQNHLLKPGDSLLFHARVAHSGACVGRRPVTALSIRIADPREVGR